MRKVLALLLVAVMMLSFAACGSEGDTTATTVTTVVDGATTLADTENTTVADTENTTEADTENTTEANDDTTVADDTNKVTTVVVTEAKATTTKAPTATTVAGNAACQHISADKPTCLEPGKCKDCGAEVKAALGHYFYKGACVRCKEPEVAAVEVKSIKLNKTELSLTEGEAVTLKATITPDDADKTLTWTSSNPAVATVSATGEVTGAGNGEAVITATAKNGVKATCKVTVAELLIGKLDYPVVVRYPADHNKKSAFEFSIDEVTYEYKNGNLKLSFKGGISYSSGDSTPTTPSFGWQLYSSNGSKVGEGVWMGDHAESVGGQYGGLIEELKNITPGRYELDIYSTFGS